MPGWEEYKTAAKARGSLALELYVVQSTPAASGPPVPDVLPDHLAYQQELEKSGNLAFAGPLSDASGEKIEGSGMIVYRAGSLEEARKLAEADPMHKTGARTFTILRWLVNEGSLTLSVGLSTNSVDLS